jgi:hypothetical protein
LTRHNIQVCQKSIGINASEVAAIWVRGMLRQAYSKVTGDANEARQLDGDSNIDFDAAMKAETDPAKKDALEKEKELLFGTIKAWTENITFMYVCLNVPTYTHTYIMEMCVCVCVFHDVCL